MLRVLVCDDHPVFRLGIKHALAAMVPRAEVSEAGTVADAIRLIGSESFDAAIVDLALPDGSGLDVAQHIRVALPSASVAVVTATPIDDAKRECARAGVQHVFPKESPVSSIIDALVSALGEQQVIVGRDPQRVLSHRELEVLSGIRAGLNNRDIADRLEISAETVKAHVSAILVKLEVANRTDAAVVAAQWSVQPMDLGTRS